MNPIKTPQEMLFEQAGLPHYAVGSAVTSGARQLLEYAIKKFTQVYGKPPSPQEMAQLEQEVQQFSKPTSSMAGANPARLAKQEPRPDMFADTEGFYYAQKPGGGMPTPRQRDYGMSQLQGPPQAGNQFVRKPQMERAFDPRDEFMTHSATGRTNAGTRQAAFNPEVNAADEQSILANMDTGTEMGGYPGQSITPANDYLAHMADVAQAQGARHDYTGMGPAVFGNRPSFGAGTLTKQQKEELEKWREMARAAGIPESAIMAKPTRLGQQFDYLKQELEMGAPGPEATMGRAEGGHITPSQMQHMMMAYGHTPQRFAGGHSVDPENQFAHIVETAQREPSLMRRGLRKAGKYAGHAFNIANPALQAMAAYDTGERLRDMHERFQSGDIRGGAVSGVGAIGSGIGMLPGIAPALASMPLSMGSDYLNQYLDENRPTESILSGTKLNTFNK